MAKITGTLHGNLCTFIMISCSITLRIRTFQTKFVEPNQNTHFMFSNFSPEKRVVYEIMWKNMAVSDRPQMRI